MGLRWKYLLIAVVLIDLDVLVAFQCGVSVWQAYSDFRLVRLLLILFVAVWTTCLADLWSRAIYRLKKTPGPRRERLSNVAMSTAVKMEARDV